MKPPHWLCQYCGIIINDSGREPNPCTWCGHSGFFYLGYEDEYDNVDVRAEHNIFFDPAKFETSMQAIYWEKLSEIEKAHHQREIDELNERVKQRRVEMGFLFD